MLTAMTRPGNSREMMELVKDRTFTVSKEKSEMRLCLGKARDLRKERSGEPLWVQCSIRWKASAGRRLVLGIGGRSQAVGHGKLRGRSSV